MKAVREYFCLDDVSIQDELASQRKGLSWELKVKAYDRNSDYHMLHHSTYGLSNMIILIRKDFKKFVKNIKDYSLGLSKLSSGINGAVAISFNLIDRRLLFINCRLEEHMDNRKARMEQWNQIYTRLVLKSDNETSQILECTPPDQMVG